MPICATLKPMPFMNSFSTGTHSSTPCNAAPTYRGRNRWRSDDADAAPSVALVSSMSMIVVMRIETTPEPPVIAPTRDDDVAPLSSQPPTTKFQAMEDAVMSETEHKLTGEDPVMTARVRGGSNAAFADAIEP